MIPQSVELGGQNPTLACPSFWFTFDGTARNPKKRRAVTRDIWMLSCLVCGKPIFTYRSRPFGFPKMCRTKPGTLPGTSCQSIYRQITMPRKVRPYGLKKILSVIQGGEFLAEPGEVPPTIRESY